MSCLLYFLRSSDAITSTLHNVYTTAIHWVAFLPILTSSALSLLNVQCASTQTTSTMCEYTHAHTLHPPPLHQSVSMLLLILEAWKCDFIQSSYPPYILSPRKHSRAPPENRSQDALFSDASWGCLLPLSPITAYGEVYLPWHNPGFYLQLSASE